jgi:ATP phosphoribosyltransferase
VRWLHDVNPELQEIQEEVAVRPRPLPFFLPERTLVQSPTIEAPPTVVLVPKNRGLAAMADYALRLYGPSEPFERTAVRGEDVPLLANEVARSGRSVLAFTGEDLLDEWVAGGRKLDGRLTRRSVPWIDSNARYGKPALCFIGPSGVALPESGELRVALCAKYEHLARRYLQTLERPGLRIEPIAISGTVEATILHNLADFMIDVVVSGKTIDELGLEVQEIIMKSDLALLEAGR